MAIPLGTHALTATRTTNDAALREKVMEAMSVYDEYVKSRTTDENTATDGEAVKENKEPKKEGEGVEEKA